MNFQRLFRHKTMHHLIETVGVEYEGRIQYSSQGGGFIHTMDTSKLEAEFEPYQWPDFEQANVTYDCAPDDLAIPAYLNGKRWNGWVMPWFPASSVPAVIEQFPFVTFDAAREECTVCEPDGDDCYVVKAEEIPVGAGKTIKAYPIGAGAWTWETTSNRGPAAPLQGTDPMEQQAAQPIRKCPTTERYPDDIVGCGSTNVSEPDHEGLCDCHDCGIWFRADEHSVASSTTA